MKKLLFISLLSLLVSCIPETQRPKTLIDKKVLYISSVYVTYSGGGKFPIRYYQNYVISSTNRGADTVMVLEYSVPEEDTPLKFNLGDTLHLNFKH